MYAAVGAFFAKIAYELASTETLPGQIGAFLLENLGKFADKGTFQKATASHDFNSAFLRFLFEVAFVDEAIELLIEKMWKGVVLMNSMSANKLAKRADSFSRPLELYLDTNVIFSLLGLHNPILNRATKELFQLIQQTKDIHVYVYDETIREFDRILDVFEVIKGNFYDIEVDSVFYFLKKQGFDSARILNLKEGIESELDSRGITLRSCRPIDGLTSDYFEQLYGELLGYRTDRNNKLPDDTRRTDIQLERSAYHDAKVLSNVLINKNKRSRNIQDVGSLFLTGSNNLYNDYLRLFRRIEAYPCVVRDISLTNWLYIMNPVAGGGPQLESILGMHSSSLFIESRVWQRYVSSLKGMLLRETISIKEFALMVSNNRAVIEFLHGATGDSLTEETIREKLRELGQTEYARDREYESALAAVRESRAKSEALLSEQESLQRKLAIESEKNEALRNLAAGPPAKRRYRRHLFGSILSVSSYVVFIAAAGLFYYLQSTSKLFLFGLVVFLFPFVRSFVRHENILSTLRFLLSQRRRKEKRAEFLTVEREALSERKVEG